MTCPPESDTTYPEDRYGTKSVLCSTFCVWENWGNWSKCIERSAGSPPVCTQQRTRSRSCGILPCPRQIPCATLDEEVLTCDCPEPPEDKCTQGDTDLNNETLHDARLICDGKNPSQRLDATAITTTPTDPHDYHCTCVAQPDTCTAGDITFRNMTVPAAEDDCTRASPHKRFNATEISPRSCECNCTDPPPPQCPDPDTRTIAQARGACAMLIEGHGNDGDVVHGTYADLVFNSSTCLCSIPTYIYKRCVKMAFHDLGTNLGCSGTNSCTCEDYKNFFIGAQSSNEINLQSRIRSDANDSACQTDTLTGVSCRTAASGVSNCCMIPANLISP